MLTPRERIKHERNGVESDNYLFCLSQAIIEELKVVQNSGDLNNFELYIQVGVFNSLWMIWSDLTNQGMLRRICVVFTAPPGKLDWIYCTLENLYQNCRIRPALPTSRPLRPHVQPCLGKLQRSRFSCNENNPACF